MIVFLVPSKFSPPELLPMPPPVLRVVLTDLQPVSLQVSPPVSPPVLFPSASEMSPTVRRNAASVAGKIFDSVVSKNASSVVTSTAASSVAYVADSDAARVITCVVSNVIFSVVSNVIFSANVSVAARFFCGVVANAVGSANDSFISSVVGIFFARTLSLMSLSISRLWHWHLIWRQCCRHDPEIWFDSSVVRRKLTLVLSSVSSPY